MKSEEVATAVVDIGGTEAGGAGTYKYNLALLQTMHFQLVANSLKSGEEPINPISL